MADDTKTDDKADDKTAPDTFTSEQVAEMVAKETAGLKAKVDELLGESKSAKDAKRKAEEEAAKKSGDIEALEKSWSEKMAAEVSKAQGDADNLRALVDKLTVGATSAKLASELAVPGSAKVLEALIAPRLAAEIKDGEARVVVKDPSGKPSAFTLDDLKAELMKDAALAPILVGSKASGGGAAGGNGGAAQKTVTRSEWDKMDHGARATFSKSGGKVVSD